MKSTLFWFYLLCRWLNVVVGSHYVDRKRCSLFGKHVSKDGEFLQLQPHRRRRNVKHVQIIFFYFLMLHRNARTVSSVMVNSEHGQGHEATSGILLRASVTFARRIELKTSKLYCENIPTTLFHSLPIEFDDTLSCSQINLLLFHPLRYSSWRRLDYTFWFFMDAIHHIYLIKRESKDWKEKWNWFDCQTKSNRMCVECACGLSCLGATMVMAINECHYTSRKTTIAPNRTAITHVDRNRCRKCMKILIRHTDCFRFCGCLLATVLFYDFR